jgi:hypothetical protein
MKNQGIDIYTNHETSIPQLQNNNDMNFSHKQSE